MVIITILSFQGFLMAASADIKGAAQSAADKSTKAANEHIGQSNEVQKEIDKEKKEKNPDYEKLRALEYRKEVLQEQIRNEIAAAEKNQSLANKLSEPVEGETGKGISQSGEPEKGYYQNPVTGNTEYGELPKSQNSPAKIESTGDKQVTDLGKMDPKADWATKDIASTSPQQTQQSAPNLSDSKSFTETADKGYLKNSTDNQTYFKAEDGSIYRTTNSEYAKAFSNGTAGTDEVMKGLQVYDRETGQWLKWSGGGMTPDGQYQHSFSGNGKTLNWNSGSNGNIARISAAPVSSNVVKLSKIQPVRVPTATALPPDVIYLPRTCGPNGCGH